MYASSTYSLFNAYVLISLLQRPKLSTTQSQYFETRPKVIRGASGGSKTPNERASTWNVTSPSPGLTKST